MKRVYFKKSLILTLLVVFVVCIMTFCGKSTKKLLCQSWYGDIGSLLYGNSDNIITMTFNSDGTYDTSYASVSATGEWSLEDDNKLKTTMDGVTTTYIIKEIEKNKLVLTYDEGEGSSFDLTLYNSVDELKGQSATITTTPTSESNDGNYSSTAQVESSTTLTEIDPFENLTLTYTGVSPYITATTDVSMCSDVVNNYVNFKLSEESNLKNGDRVTVSAEGNSNFEKEGYTLKTTTKEYVVSNAPEYIKSIDGIDTKEIQAEIDDKLSSVTATNEGDFYFAGTKVYSPYGSVASKKLKSTYLISLKNNFEDEYDRSPYNRYMQVYNYIINVKDGKQKEVYVMIYVDNLYTDTDGKLNWKFDLNSTSSDNYNNIINEYITKQKEHYNVTEIK